MRYVMPIQVSKFLDEMFAATGIPGTKTLGHLLAYEGFGVSQEELNLDAEREIGIADSLTEKLLADFSTFNETH